MGKTVAEIEDMDAREFDMWKVWLDSPGNYRMVEFEVM